MKRIICGLMVLAYTALAADQTEEILDRLAAAEKNLQVVSFSFSQSVEIPMAKEKATLEGTVLFAPPKRFRLEYQQPGQTIVSDGKTLWLYQVSRRQVVIDDWDRWLESSGYPRELAPFHMTVQEMVRDFEITWEGTSESPAADIVKLVPRKKSRQPWVLRLWVSRTEGFPLRTELKSSSVTTQLDIRQRTVNPTLSGDPFTFHPPENVSVLDMRTLGSERQP